jgi:hypothetical protein
VPRLTRPRFRRGERGAVAALVALLAGGGVLLGMSALVVDVGLLYVERAELQSGADAASSALARVCVSDNNDDCNTNQMRDRTGEYARGNAKDGQAAVTICGHLTADGDGQLPGCGSAEPTNLTACVNPRPTDPDVPWVEVRTSTRRPGGSTVLPPVFSSAIAGGGGTTVAACSRVSWGPILDATSPVSLMVCQTTFNAATRESDGDHVYQPPPPNFVDGRAGAHDFEADEVVLNWGAGTACGGSSNGFKWIGPDSGPCNHRFIVGDHETATNQRRIPDRNRCEPAMRTARNRDNPAPVPVAVLADDGEAVGIAMFVITGWRSGPGWDPPEGASSTLTGRRDCPSSGTPFCLFGYFTTKVFAAQGSAPLGAHHYGAVYLKTIG